MVASVNVNVQANMAQFNAAMQEASARIGRFGDAVRQGGPAFSTMSKGAQQLVQEINPALAAIDRLEQQFLRLNQAVQSGAISAGQGATMMKELGDTARAATGGLGAMTIATAGATREFIVLGHEMLQGNWSRIPGSLMVLGERLGGLQNLFGGIGVTAGVAGAAILAVGGAAAYAAYQMFEAYEATKTLTSRMLVMGQSQIMPRDAMRKFVQDWANDFNESFGQVNTAVDKFVGKLGPEFTPFLGRIREITEGFKVVNDISLSKAAEELAKLSPDPEGWIKYAKSINAITPEMAALAEQAIKLGDRQKAAEIASAALYERFGKEGAQVAKTRAEWESYLKVLGSQPPEAGMVPLGMPEPPKTGITEAFGLPTTTPAAPDATLIQAQTAEERLLKDEEQRKFLSEEMVNLKLRELQLTQQLAIASDADAQNELARIQRAEQINQLEQQRLHTPTEAEAFNLRLAQYDADIKKAESNEARKKQLIDERAQFEADYYGRQTAQGQQALNQQIDAEIAARNQSFAIWMAEQQNREQHLQRFGQGAAAIPVQQDVVNRMKQLGMDETQPQQYQAQLMRLRQMQDEAAIQGYEQFAAKERGKIDVAKDSWDKISAIYQEWADKAKALFGENSVQFQEVQDKIVKAAKEAADKLLAEKTRYVSESGNIELRMIKLQADAAEAQNIQRTAGGKDPLSNIDAQKAEAAAINDLANKQIQAYEEIAKAAGDNAQAKIDALDKAADMAEKAADKEIALAKQVAEEQRKAAEEAGKVYKEAIDGIGSAFEKLLDFSKTRQEAFTSFYQSLEKTLTSTAEKLLSQMAAKGLGKLFGVEVKPGEGVGDVLGSMLGKMLGIDDKDSQKTVQEALKAGDKQRQTAIDILKQIADLLKTREQKFEEGNKNIPKELQPGGTGPGGGTGGAGTGAPGTAGGPYGTVANSGQPGTPAWEAENLTTISSQGHSIQVNKKIAGQAQALLDDLTKEGYKIDTLGGYEYRNVAGSKNLSQHAFGYAMDINARRNEPGMQTDLPADFGQLAAAHGFRWGANFRKPDPMHVDWMGPGSGTATAAASTKPQQAAEQAANAHQKVAGAAEHTSTAVQQTGSVFEQVNTALQHLASAAEAAANKLNQVGGKNEAAAPSPATGGQTSGSTTAHYAEGGLAPGEIPAILHEGERVLNPKETAAYHSVFPRGILGYQKYHEGGLIGRYQEGGMPSPEDSGDPEAAAAAQASTMMEPVVGPYLSDVVHGKYAMEGMERYFGPNADPMEIALAFSGPGSIRGLRPGQPLPFGTALARLLGRQPAAAAAETAATAVPAEVAAQQTAEATSHSMATGTSGLKFSHLESLYRIPADADNPLTEVWNIHAHGFDVGEVGRVHIAKYPDQPNTAEIDMIKGFLASKTGSAGEFSRGEGPATFGPRFMRDMASDYFSRFPDIAEIRGLRVSGARERAGITGYASLFRSQVMKGEETSAIENRLREQADEQRKFEMEHLRPVERQDFNVPDVDPNDVPHFAAGGMVAASTPGLTSLTTESRGFAPVQLVQTYPGIGKRFQILLYTLGAVGALGALSWMFGKDDKKDKKDQDLANKLLASPDKGTTGDSSQTTTQLPADQVPDTPVPKYHSGGIAPDETLAVLQQGERVIPKFGEGGIARYADGGTVDAEDNPQTPAQQQQAPTYSPASRGGDGSQSVDKLTSGMSTLSFGFNTLAGDVSKMSQAFNQFGAVARSTTTQTGLLSGIFGAVGQAASGLKSIFGIFGGGGGGGDGGGGGGFLGTIGSLFGGLKSIFGLFALEGGGIIPSAAGGMIVPTQMMRGGGSLAILHPNEMVLPRDISDHIQRSVGRDQSGGPGSTDSGGGSDVHFHLHTIDQRSGAQFLMNNKDTIASMYQNSFRNFNPNVHTY